MEVRKSFVPPLQISVNNQFFAVIFAFSFVKFSHS